VTSMRLILADESVTTADYAHQQVVTALDEPHVNSLVAVTWASAHLAAAERVLYPLAARTLTDGRDRVRAQVDVDHRLQHVLWRLDRLLTGDVHQRWASAEHLEDELRHVCTSTPTAKLAPLRTCGRTSLLSSSRTSPTGSAARCCTVPRVRIPTHPMAASSMDSSSASAGSSTVYVTPWTAAACRFPAAPQSLVP
jgi:hypothetical protein